MLRQSLARSAWRAGRRTAHVSRTFATTPQRQAEVELTIGKTACSQWAVDHCTDNQFRWKESFGRRYAHVESPLRELKQNVDRIIAGSALIQACEKAGVTIPRYADDTKDQLQTHANVE